MVPHLSDISHVPREDFKAKLRSVFPEIAFQKNSSNACNNQVLKKHTNTSTRSRKSIIEVGCFNMMVISQQSLTYNQTLHQAPMTTSVHYIDLKVISHCKRRPPPASSTQQRGTRSTSTKEREMVSFMHFYTTIIF